MSDSPSTIFNERGFRDALGLFATGVAIITAQVGDEKLGATVSSFNSVSLKPPLVLFSLTRTSFELRQMEGRVGFRHLHSGRRAGIGFQSLRAGRRQQMVRARYPARWKRGAFAARRDRPL